MVILGLGTNVGARLTSLRKAYQYLLQLKNFTLTQVSPIYVSDALLPENAPASWNCPYFNLAIRAETTLAPEELLIMIKAIEKNMGRKTGDIWAPRIIDIDILAWDDRVLFDKQLHIPHEHLAKRPFALWPLADVAPFWQNPLPGEFYQQTASQMASQWGPREKAKAPFNTHVIAHRVDTPQLVGIINLTPDSFSDASLYTSSLPKELVAGGADVLDFGAEATGPHAQAISTSVEWSRLEPALTHFLAHKDTLLENPKVSIDTYHPKTAALALKYNVDWINDVSGLTHPAMQEVLLPASCDIVFMHNLGVPVSKSALIPLHEDPVAHVFQWASLHLNTLIRAGFTKERLIFDVGIGFGKTAEQSLTLLQNIHVFKNLGIRLLVGHSRKSFLKCFTTLKAAASDLETCILSLCIAPYVDYLRIHNVLEHARAFKVNAAMKNIP